MSAHIDLNGILIPSGMDRYSQAFKKKLISSTKKAMQSVGSIYRDKIRVNAENGLKIKRKAVIKSFSFKVYFQRAGKVPSLHFYSRVPWMGMHDKGGVLSKNVLIPLLSKRIGYKALKTLLASLSAANNLHFDKTGNTTIAWCKNTQQFKGVLIPFKKMMKSKTGNTVKKDERVNIAIVGKNIRLKKKIRMTEIALESVPKVTREIERLFTL